MNAYRFAAIVCGAVVSAFLTGCVGTAFNDGSTSAFQIGENRWIAYYEGNGEMGRPLVMEYGLGYTASLALEKGYTYYTILGVQNDADSSTYYTPQTYHSTASVIGRDGGIVETGYFTGGMPVTTTINSVSITFEGYKERRDGALSAVDTWNAFVDKYLTPKE